MIYLTPIFNTNFLFYFIYYYYFFFYNIFTKYSFQLFFRWYSRTKSLTNQIPLGAALYSHELFCLVK